MTAMTMGNASLSVMDQFFDEPRKMPDAKASGSCGWSGQAVLAAARGICVITSDHPIMDASVNRQCTFPCDGYPNNVDVAMDVFACSKARRSSSENDIGTLAAARLVRLPWAARVVVKNSWTGAKMRA